MSERPFPSYTWTFAFAWPFFGLVFIGWRYLSGASSDALLALFLGWIVIYVVVLSLFIPIDRWRRRRAQRQDDG